MTPPAAPPAVRCDLCGAPINARRVAVIWRKRTPLLVCAACRAASEEGALVQGKLEMGEQAR